MKVMKNVLKVCVCLILVFFSYNYLSKNSNPSGYPNLIEDKVMVDGDTIHIQGLGDFNEQSLINAKQIVQNTYNVPVVIDKPIKISDEYYVETEVIDADKFMKYYDSDVNTIYITNERGYSIKSESPILGKGKILSNIVLVTTYNQKTLNYVLIHEISHNIGLTHCENENCIMYKKYNKNNLKLKFCNECRKSL